MDRLPLLHCAPPTRIELRGRREPVAQLRERRIAARMQFRHAVMSAPLAKRPPAALEPVAIVQEPRAFEHFHGIGEPGVRPVLRKPRPARLQKRRTRLAPSRVFGKLLHRASLCRGRPAELRPALPVRPDPPGQLSHLPRAGEIPRMFRQHPVGKTTRWPDDRQRSATRAIPSTEVILSLALGLRAS